jgi:hypothetical protein
MLENDGKIFDFVYFYSQQCQVTMFFPFTWKRCEDFSILDSILKGSGKKSNMHVLGTDTNPGRQDPDGQFQYIEPVPDPDSQHCLFLFLAQI